MSYGTGSYAGAAYADSPTGATPAISISPSSGNTAGARTITITYTGGATASPANTSSLAVQSGPGGIGAYIYIDTTHCSFVYTQAGPSATPTVFRDNNNGLTATYSNQGAASAPGAPGTPTLVNNGNGTLTATFAPPASDGGASITRYDVLTSSGETAFGATSPITVTVGTAASRTVTATATNSAGTGPASSASNAVTPTGVVATNRTQVKLAPFFASDVIGTAVAQAFKYSGGSMVVVGSAPTVNTVANIANGREALVSVPPESDGGFHGVIRWNTGSGSPQYFAEELYMAPTVTQAMYTIAKVCNLPQGTDISGTIGYQLRSGSNAAIGGRVTAGIYTTPLVTGPDKFCADITLAPGSYFMVWDNGAGIYSQDEMLVLGALPSSGGGGSVIPVNPGAAGTLTFPQFTNNTTGVQANLAISEIHVLTMGGIVIASLGARTANSVGIVPPISHANAIIGTAYLLIGYDAAGTAFHNVLVAT